MTDNHELHQLAGKISSLFNQAVLLSYSEVDAIILRKDTNVRLIEYQLDHMLGFCCDSDMLVAFKQLCRYYYGIDPVAASGYVQAYREMWDTPDESDPATETA